jgi:hypothetical protein
VEGLKRSAHALHTTSAEAFAVQALLSLKNERREMLEEDDNEIFQSSTHLLTASRNLPGVNEEDYAHLGKKGVRVSQALVFDPSIFRYVRVPSLLCAMADANVSLRGLDKMLSDVGLVSLKGFSTQGWGDTQRLAVKRGHGRSFGKPLPSVWQVLGVPSEDNIHPSPTSPYGSLLWFREAVAKGLGVVDRTPLDWDEWLDLSGGPAPA